MSEYDIFVCRTVLAQIAVSTSAICYASTHTVLREKQETPVNASWRPQNTVDNDWINKLEHRMHF